MSVEFSEPGKSFHSLPINIGHFYFFLVLLIFILFNMAYNSYVSSVLIPPGRPASSSCGSVFLVVSWNQVLTADRLGILRRSTQKSFIYRGQAGSTFYLSCLYRSVHFIWMLKSTFEFFLQCFQFPHNDLTWHGVAALFRSYTLLCLFFDLRLPMLFLFWMFVLQRFFVNYICARWASSFFSGCVLMLHQLNTSAAPKRERNLYMIAHMWRLVTFL